MFYYACSGCGYVCLGTTSRPTLTVNPEDS
nr:MAG TPA: Orsellinic acid biosynthesis cluster protein D [Caudoviricetes sp.]DAZ73374.1 MAG TPA: Orsellinic acid biosynthesis cluster protein D [Caudoviricetes sp.]